MGHEASWLLVASRGTGLMWLGRGRGVYLPGFLTSATAGRSQLPPVAMFEELGEDCLQCQCVAPLTSEAFQSALGEEELMSWYFPRSGEADPVVSVKGVTDVQLPGIVLFPEIVSWPSVFRTSGLRASGSLTNPPHPVLPPIQDLFHSWAHSRKTMQSWITIPPLETAPHLSAFRR